MIHISFKTSREQYRLLRDEMHAKGSSLSEVIRSYLPKPVPKYTPIDEMVSNDTKKV